MCPETRKMQPKHNGVHHVLLWLCSLVAHHNLVGVMISAWQQSTAYDS